MIESERGRRPSRKSSNPRPAPATSDRLPLARPRIRLLDPVPSVDPVAGWIHRAACRGTGVDQYFPTGRAAAGAARATCAGCAARAECLAYALADPTLHGVWGGTSDAERHALRPAARRAAGPAGEGN